MNNLIDEWPLTETAHFNERFANYKIAKMFETVFMEIRKLAWHSQNRNHQERLIQIGELADLFHCMPKALLTNNPDWSELENLLQAAGRYQSSHMQAAPFSLQMEQVMSSLRQLKNS
jgi:hypothetical protein